MTGKRIQYQLFILTLKVAVSTLVLLSIVYSTYITAFSEGNDDYSWIPTVHDWVLTLISGVLSSIVALGFAWIFAKKIIVPLNAIALSARKISEGQLSERVDHDVKEIYETTVLINDFNTMADKLEIMSSEMKKWNAAIAHELRTPVTILQGRIMGIRDGIFEMNVQQFDILLSQTLGLSRLIDDLRVLSLSDSGHLSLYRENVQLKNIILETIRLFNDDLIMRGITPILNVSEVTGYLDEFRITQAFSALLSNSVKYSISGILIITCREKGNEILITVEDEGPGINAEEAEKIFEAFYRSSNSRSNENDGSGLGLAVVKSIINAHGGSVNYRSSHLGGSCIEIALPIISF